MAQPTMHDAYYLAALADEIYVDPLGFVLLDGYSRYRLYYKDVLDKLNVDINVFRVGKFKSAVEDYTRNDMSPEDREKSQAYLNALWTSYQKAPRTARASCPPDAIANYVNALPQAVRRRSGDAAQVALKARLVTGIKSRLEVEQRAHRHGR